MSKSKIKSRYIYVIIMMMLANIIIPTNISFAQESQFPSSVDLDKFSVNFIDTKIIKEDSQEIGMDSNNPITASKTYNIVYYMDISNYRNPSDVTTSSAIKLKIPEEFVTEDTVIPINVTGIDSVDKVKIAEVFVEKNGNAEIKFLSIDEKFKDTYDLSDVYFSIGAKLDESKVDSDGEKNLKFDIFDRSITKSFYLKKYEPEAVNAVIGKHGNFKLQNKSIYWNIDIIEKGNQIKKGSYIYDKLDTNLMKFVSVKDNLGNNVDYSYEATSGELKCFIPENFVEPYSVIIETKLKTDQFQSSGITPVRNTAFINNLEGNKISNDASTWVGVSLLADNTLIKDGNYNSKNHRISWKIAANSNVEGITSTLIEDNIDVQEKLDISTIKINGKQIQASDFNFNENTSVLQINPGDITSELKYITFETEVLNKEHYSSNYNPINYWNYKNKITMKNKIGEKELPIITTMGYVHVGSKLLEKKFVSYNYDTKEITWEIVVNSNEMPISNAVLIDYIPEGQSYVQKSLIMLDKNGHFFNAYDFVDFEKIYIDNKENLKLKFLNKLEDEYTFILKTKLNPDYADNIFCESGNKELKNSVELYGDEIYLGKVESTAKMTVENKLISKTGEQKSNELGIKTDKPIVWEILVNPNRINIENGVITDILSPKLNLDTETIKLYEVNIDQDGSKTLGDEVSFDKSNVIFNYFNNELKFKLPTPTNKCYKLIFETTILDETLNTISNEAYLSGIGISKIQDSSKADNVHVQITNSGGTASKLLGKIKLYKYDSSYLNKLKPLSGAEFEIIDSFGIVRDKKTTNTNGILEFSNVRINEMYLIRESLAPEGYKKSSLNELVKLDILNKEKVLVFYNDPIKEITKPNPPSEPNLPSEPKSSPSSEPNPPSEPKLPSEPKSPSEPKLSAYKNKEDSEAIISEDIIKLKNNISLEKKTETVLKNKESIDMNTNPKTGDINISAIFFINLMIYIFLKIKILFTVKK